MRVIMYITNLSLCCVCFVIIWHVCVNTVHNKHIYYVVLSCKHVDYKISSLINIINNISKTIFAINVLYFFKYLKFLLLLY